MNKANHLDKKHQMNDADDEQIVKTLNYFDSILDPYLCETDDKSSTPINQSLQTPPSTSSSSSSSSSSHRRRHHHQQQPFVRPAAQVRRFISETNLNQLPSSATKRKLSHPRPLRTTATSTEDLTKLPSQTKFIRKIDKLSSNGASASLIDLSSIDKTSSRPRFRFVPPTDNQHVLKEEPEIEQPFHLKTIPSNQKPPISPSKPTHKIVKPTVIIPNVPKTMPINRLTESHIHHQNDHSAFKPARSSKYEQSLINSDLSRIQHHQSVLNLSSIEPIYPTRMSQQQQPTKNNGYLPTHKIIPETSIVKLIQQVNNTSSITGLVQPENRNKQVKYPHGSYISTNVGLSAQRPQTYYNSPKYHPGPRNGLISYSPNSSTNVYNFNQNPSSRDGQSKRHVNRQSATITTYL